MRGSGRAWLAIVLAALAVVGAGGAERLGPATPSSGAVGDAVSSVWLCPHGGGPGWRGTIEIANPGDVAVQARLTSFGDGEPTPAGQEEVPPHATVSSDVPDRRGAPRPSAAFRRMGAVRLGTRRWNEAAFGAEPCTSEPGGHWASRGRESPPSKRILSGRDESVHVRRDRCGVVRMGVRLSGIRHGPTCGARTPVTLDVGSRRSANRSWASI